MTWWDAQSKKLYEIIEQIALDLIASGAWAEADATWTTATRTAENARRAIYHAGDGLYLAMVACNTSRVCGSWYGKGIAIYLSTAWASNIPSGTVYVTYIPYEGHTAAVNADLATAVLTTWLFTDAVGGTGFALYINPAANATDTLQSNIFLVFERCAAQLYSDTVAGGKPWYLWNYPNFVTNSLFGYASYTTSGTLLGQALLWYSTLKPFVTQATVYRPFGGVILDGSFECGLVAYQGMMAYKSITDGKAYYMKPLINNKSLYPPYPFFNKPVIECEFWFYIDNTKATIAHNDIIAVVAPSTKTYLAVLQTSPDSAVTLPIAMVKTL